MQILLLCWLYLYGTSELGQRWRLGQVLPQLLTKNTNIYIYINSCCLWYLKWDYSLHCIMQDQVLHCPHLSPTHTHWTSLKVLLPPYLLTANNNQPQGLCTLYSYLRDFNFFEVSLKHTLQVRPSLTLYIKHHTLAHLIHHPTYLALFFSQ